MTKNVILCLSLILCPGVTLRFVPWKTSHAVFTGRLWTCCDTAGFKLVTLYSEGHPFKSCERCCLLFASFVLFSYLWQIR